MFLRISTHFTATPGIPLSSSALKTSSIGCSYSVELSDFTPDLQAAYTPFTPSKSGQRSTPLYYRGCWHRVSRVFLLQYNQTEGLFTLQLCSCMTELYNPKAFITHAALLHQAFAHCGKFPTAASRRSLDRVSVPVWPYTLSGRLLIVALVGRYPTNKLIRRELIPKR